MKKNPGQFVLRVEDNIVKRDTVLQNPRKVEILINSEDSFKKVEGDKIIHPLS